MHSLESQNIIEIKLSMEEEERIFIAKQKDNVSNKAPTPQIYITI